MSWRNYFMDNPELEQMYDAFKERMEAEADGETFDLYAEEQDREARREQEDIDDHHYAYEEVERYREQYANNKGYKFKPKEYDRDEKYKGKRFGR